MEKPPVLSDEEVTRIIFECKGNCSDARLAVNVAQRDADVEWYEKKYLIPDYEWNLQQARQDTARKIFEEIEKLTTVVDIGKMSVPVIDANELQSLKSKFLIHPNPVGSADL